MGALRLAVLVRRVKGPVYGLGGVDNKKARLLKDTGLVGLAAVEAFTPPRT
jgi:thiamine-phosphate pyrophosphorylase